MGETVKVRELGKRYGAKKVFEFLDLSFGAGVIGLLGPNGAGKTTLLRCLATVLRPDSGRMEIFGLDPARRAQRTELRRRIGYLPQNPGLYPHFTAQAMVDYVARLKEVTDRRVRREEVQRVLAEVDLTEAAGTRVRKLSGGMRQRLGIAQALVGDPQFLVLDEPTVGLDPGQRMRFRALAARLGQDRTVLLSTHQTEDIAALCDRVIVFDEGRVAFDGTPSELAGAASGRVWSSDTQPGTAQAFWRTADGRYRVVGERPPGSTAVVPTVEDGYLQFLGTGVRA
ncbi:ATP-binding cassette domain-containing protein [Streptomyces sp. NPDC007100]|uniref:ATP-binding cassette domain-containing protein n=1 Tax=Streptomyces sp. NPDC007100 TaxID=3155602 RepID=UPI0033C6AF82